MPRKKRQKKNSLQGWLLWMALTAAFSLVGMGLASFQGHLFVSGTVDIGDCSVEFVGTPILDYEHLAERVTDDGSTGDTTEYITDSMSHTVVVITDHSTSQNQENDNQASAPELNLGPHDDKSIKFNITNAYPGDIYKLGFEVENTGTIPVVMDLGASEISQQEDENPSINGMTLDPGESYSEELMIEVSESVEGDFSYIVVLNYKQAVE